jgi:hypothetical protein
MRLATRRVRTAGIVPEPTGSWMAQTARHLTDDWDGYRYGCCYLIYDRSSLCMKECETIL